MKSSGIAEVNGTHLYYEVAGSGEPAVVLIHGFTLDSRMWDGQFEAFAGRRRVVRYDLRGFGRSALPGREGYTHAADLKALLGHLGVERASIVGLSLGASVAVSFTLTCPEVSGSLVLADPALAGYRWSSEWRASIKAIEGVARSSGEKAANRLWLEHPLFAPAREREGVAARLAEIVSEYSGWHWLNDDPQLRGETPDIERLGRIGCPTLVVVGERDLQDFRAIAGVLLERIPGARISRVDGAGHMANMEAPRAFNEAVLQFLRGS